MENKISDIITDEIPEKIHRSLHLTYFIVKMLVIGAAVFWAAQLIFLALVVDPDKEQSDEDSTFVTHNYCGTFFVTHTAENTYGSAEAEELAVSQANAADGTSVTAVIEILLIASTLVCLFIALRCSDKKIIFAGRSSRFFIAAGITYALTGFLSEYTSYSSEKILRNYYIGIFADSRYYCQLYNVLGIPFIIFCCGLILRQHERMLHGQDTKKNGTALKRTAAVFLVIASGFMLCRFGVRAYELIMVLMGREVSVRLPFYCMLLELPHELAKTPSDYTRLVAFRFVKDLPVFAASAVTVILFAKVLLSAAEGGINTAVNRRRITVSIVSLIISSLLFNLLGLVEIKLLNSGFTGIYGDVEYTVGIRSLCEPTVYALVLWFFSVYIRCVPQSS